MMEGAENQYGHLIWSKAFLVTTLFYKNDFEIQTDHKRVKKMSVQWYTLKHKQETILF